MKIEKARLLDNANKPVPFRESPNHGDKLLPRFLVMHYTAGRSTNSSAGWLCNPRAKASAHLVIGRDGKTIQLVPFNVVAWHAGASSWRDSKGDVLTGMNQYAIGIELDNPGRVVRHGAKWRSLALGSVYPDSQVIEATHKNETTPSGWVVYPSAQLEAAQEVASCLVEAYRLEDVVGHEDIAPGRKTDPGPAFPMEGFRSRIFGRSDTSAPAAREVRTTAELNIRTGPGTEYPTVVEKPLPKGTRMEVLAVRGSWFKVDVLEAVNGVLDIQGWVHGRWVG